MVTKILYGKVNIKKYYVQDSVGDEYEIVKSGEKIFPILIRSSYYYKEAGCHFLMPVKDTNNNLSFDLLKYEKISQFENNNFNPHIGELVKLSDDATIEIEDIINHIDGSCCEYFLNYVIRTEDDFEKEKVMNEFFESEKEKFNKWTNKWTAQQKENYLSINKKNNKKIWYQFWK